eukprot:TRINITY_DN5692_c0_g1_i3.p1 TRINITY_DN5692_c0_g1~~TRINITY_DN5692_c0_g1_i3.p1  ORF type:complete len:289 (-),score=63.36 TRINITY_DN5692_c0_g1_i3:535-1401(-)
MATSPFFWLGCNLLSAISLIVLNKWLFAKESFHFSATLTFVHIFFTFIMIKASLFIGLFECKYLPFLELAKPAAASVLGLVFTNLSLLFNNIGVYQLIKLLEIPCIILLQVVFYQIYPNREELLSLFLLVTGVGLSTAQSASFTPIGLVYALLAVVSQSSLQVLVKAKQKELEASPPQLLEQQLPINLIFMVPCVPLFDDYTSATSALKFNWVTKEVIILILITCVMAGLLNISGFFVIGQFSPITYQVTSHMKTILILGLGVALFGDSAQPQMLIGLYSPLVSFELS